MSNHIDLQYRPDSYFGPVPMEQALVSKVKGSFIRNELQSMLDEGETAAVNDILSDEKNLQCEQKLLESSHPMFMGGAYLPNQAAGEVEIANISIESVTYDITSVFAKFVDGNIHYRVVDEYEGDTLTAPYTAVTDKPMTLCEFANFFLNAWPLIFVLEMNFEGAMPPEEFFTASSQFYPELDGYCRQLVEQHFDLPEDD